MAASTAEMRYADNAVYGNVAYDLGRSGAYALPEEELYTRPAERPEELTREIPREETAVRTQTRQAYGVPLFGIVGFLAAAALMVFMLLSYVQLAQISDETTQLENTIAQLDQENETLQYQYESTFNLNEIKDYAKNVLGMTEISSANIKVVEVQREDKAEILNEDDAAKGFFAGVSDFFNSLTEYFS